MRVSVVISMLLWVVVSSCVEGQKESQWANNKKIDWSDIEKKINTNDKNRLFLSYWFGMDSTEFVDVSHYLASKNSIFIDKTDFNENTVKLTYLYSKFNNSINQADTVSFTLRPFWTKDKRLARISLRLNNDSVNSKGVSWVSLREVMLDFQEQYGYPTEEDISIGPEVFEYLSLENDSNERSGNQKIPSMGKDYILLRNNRIQLFGYKKNDLRVTINQEKYKSLMYCRDMVWDCIDLMNETFMIDFTNIQQLKKEIQTVSTR